MSSYTNAGGHGRYQEPGESLNGTISHSQRPSFSLNKQNQVQGKFDDFEIGNLALSVLEMESKDKSPANNAQNYQESQAGNIGDGPLNISGDHTKRSKSST